MRRTIKGMITGALIGASAMGMVGMMNRSAQRKMGRNAVRTAQRMADKATRMFR